MGGVSGIFATFWNSADKSVNRAKIAQQVIPTISANVVSCLIQMIVIRLIAGGYYHLLTAAAGVYVPLSSRHCLICVCLYSLGV